LVAKILLETELLVQGLTQNEVFTITISKEAQMVKSFCSIDLTSLLLALSSIVAAKNESLKAKTGTELASRNSDP